MRDIYCECDIVFIQEAAGAFVQGEAGVALAAHYKILIPRIVDAKRDQNCLILVRDCFLQPSAPVTEVTDLVLEHVCSKNPAKKFVYVAGDIAVFSCVSRSGQHCLLASFHGII